MGWLERLVCWLRGHSWTKWVWFPGNGHYVRMCQRCGKFQSVGEKP